MAVNCPSCDKQIEIPRGIANTDRDLRLQRQNEPSRQLLQYRREQDLARTRWCGARAIQLSDCGLRCGSAKNSSSQIAFGRKARKHGLTLRG